MRKRRRWLRRRRGDLVLAGRGAPARRARGRGRPGTRPGPAGRVDLAACCPGERHVRLGTTSGKVGGGGRSRRSTASALSERQTTAAVRGRPRRRLVPSAQTQSLRCPTAGGIGEAKEPCFAV